MGAGDRRRAPQPPHDDPRVRQPGLHEHRRASSRTRRRSATAPRPARSGRAEPGKRYHHKDTAQIFAACHLPYVFTASEGYPEDLMRKVAKAQWYAKHEGLVYGKILSFCPLNWRTTDDAAEPVLQAAIDSCFFPLYEIEHGHTTHHLRPGRDRTAGIPSSDWLKLMGKTRHLLQAGERRRSSQGIQAEVDRRWRAAQGDARAPAALGDGDRHGHESSRRASLTPVTKLFRHRRAAHRGVGASPGQFVMLRVREGGERIPITHRRLRPRRRHASRSSSRRSARPPSASARSRRATRSSTWPARSGGAIDIAAGRPRLRRRRRLRLGRAAVPDARAARARGDRTTAILGARTQGPAHPRRRAASRCATTSRSAPTTARPASRGSSRSASRS